MCPQTYKCIPKRARHTKYLSRPTNISMRYMSKYYSSSDMSYLPFIVHCNLPNCEYVQCHSPSVCNALLLLSLTLHCSKNNTTSLLQEKVCGARNFVVSSVSFSIPTVVTAMAHHANIQRYHMCSPDSFRYVWKRNFLAMGQNTFGYSFCQRWSLAGNGKPELLCRNSEVLKKFPWDPSHIFGQLIWKDRR